MRKMSCPGAVSVIRMPPFGATHVTKTCTATVVLGKDYFKSTQQKLIVSITSFHEVTCEYLMLYSCECEYLISYSYGYTVNALPHFV